MTVTKHHQYVRMAPPVPHNWEPVPKSPTHVRVYLGSQGNTVKQVSTSHNTINNMYKLNTINTNVTSALLA